MKTAFKPVFAMVAALAVLTACNNDDDAGIPEVSTLAVTGITSTGAKSGGSVTVDEDAPVDSRGVVWSKQSAPDLENNEGLTADGSGHGVFVSVLSELGGGQSYYVRAYATNAAGTAYGQQIEFTTEDSVPAKGYPPGTVHCISGGAEIVEVTNPATGKTWMDRNLGASQAATEEGDNLARGDFYQWGRFSDGHQCQTSGTTPNIASGPSPDHGDFILSSSAEDLNWLSPQNNNLWQGVNGTNNPCPQGFRLPTEAEWMQERAEWTSHGYAAAFSSPLKISTVRSRNAGTAFFSSDGRYLSSTVSSVYARALFLGSWSAAMGNSFRGDGGTVRCIKD